MYGPRPLTGQQRWAPTCYLRPLIQDSGELEICGQHLPYLQDTARGWQGGGLVISAVSMKIKVLVAKACLTLCNPADRSPQAPPSVGFSRQESWSGLLCPPPGDLPGPGSNLSLVHRQGDSLWSETPGKPIKTSREMLTRQPRSQRGRRDFRSWVSLGNIDSVAPRL